MSKNQEIELVRRVASLSRRVYALEQERKEREERDKENVRMMRA